MSRLVGFNELLNSRMLPVGERGHMWLGGAVLLRGRVMVTRKNGLGDHSRVVEHGPGQFMAEVGSLSGRPPLVYGRAVGAVEALLIDPPSLRAALVAEAELGERIMRALILRRSGRRLSWTR